MSVTVDVDGLTSARSNSVMFRRRSTTRRTACSRSSGVYFFRFPDTGTSSQQDQRSRDQMSTNKEQPHTFCAPGDLVGSEVTVDERTRLRHPRLLTQPLRERRPSRLLHATRK